MRRGMTVLATAALVAVMTTVTATPAFAATTLGSGDGCKIMQKSKFKETKNGFGGSFEFKVGSDCSSPEPPPNGPPPEGASPEEPLP